MNRCFQLGIDLLRHSNLRIGSGIRRRCYKQVLKSMGTRVRIAPGVYLGEPENISLGDNVSIQQYCVLSGYGGLTIGNDVSIAHHCSIMTTSHPFDKPDVKIREGKLICKPVVIEDNVWIGAGVRILCGVTIHSGAVVGAGSVVTKDLPANTICAGIPAKPIRARFADG